MSDATSPLETLALELLAIPSVIGNERAIADFVEQRAQERGFAEIVRAGDNLALRPRPLRPDTPRVLLLGHLDTVPPADDNPARIEGDKLYGLGASDMQCADALVLHLLEEAVEREPRVDLDAILYAREEGPFDESGMPEIIEAAPSFFEDVALAVAMEPTDNHFELGCLGTLHAVVRFHGRRAHSARPWQGENAIHRAAPLLTALGRLEPRDCTYDGLLFREVCSATMIDFEGARNVVPGRCDVNVNFRFAPDRSRSEAMAWLVGFVTDAVGQEAIARGVVTVDFRDICPSGRVCADNAHLASLRAVAGGGAEVRAKQAWTDVGRLSEMGIDAINYGPGSPSQAHQAGEWCLRENLERARRVTTTWLFG